MLLAAPALTDAALRGLLVLRGLTRRLEGEAAALRAEQAEAQRLIRAVEAELAPLRAAQASQRAQGAALDRHLAARRSAGRQLDEAAREAAERAALQAARAETLRAAIAQLEAEQARAEARARAEAMQEERQRRLVAAPTQPRRADPPHAGSAGAFRPPMAGTVVRGWGERTEAGPASGVLLRGAPSARVVAPCAGRVAFAGPFRSFGKLVILECAGLHAVLSGLDRLDADVGEAVRAGEPVGVMPGWDPAAPGARPALYLELRRDGRPMNPAPFLRAQR